MFSLEEKRTPLLLAYDLQLFANDEGGEKTEEPTAKKIEDSRKEGQVAKSKELTSAANFLIALKMPHTTLSTGQTGDLDSIMLSISMPR